MLELRAEAAPTPDPLRDFRPTESTVVGNPPFPCPDLLTESEAVRYLRLDTINGLRNPSETLARYRAMGLLRGTQVSKSIFYRRIELERFLDRLTSENPR